MVVPTYIPQPVAVGVAPLENTPDVVAAGVMPSTSITEFFEAS